MALRHATLIAGLAITLLSTATWTPVLAQPTGPDIQAQIDAHLRDYPGGVQTGPYEITYDKGVFVMTFARSEPTPNGVADCPAGWFCFYDFTNYGYPRGKLSSCGWQDLSFYGWHDKTESVHYNISTGSVAFINHAAGETGHNFDYAIFGAGTSQPKIPDTAPNRNKADHVERYC